jgi:uncharacterized protein (TIGR03435 family)
MIRMALGAGGLLSIVLSAQSAQAPSFEVASVRPAAVSQAREGRSSASGDRVAYIHTTMFGLIASAYQVRGFQIDGPSWIRTERYDVVAKAPDNTPKDQVPLMLQALLAERFKLKVHREPRELQIYALIFVKDSPKLEKVESDAIGGVDLAADGRRRFLRTSMEQLVMYLTAMSGRPVVNKTNLAGAYNFPLELSMEEVGGINASSNATQRPSIFTSMQELGLKLDSQKGPIDMIVVDGGIKTPTEN